MDPQEAERRIRVWWAGMCVYIDHSAQHVYEAGGYSPKAKEDIIEAHRKTMISLIAAPALGYIQAYIDLGYLPQERETTLLLDLIATAEGKPIEVGHD